MKLFNLLSILIIGFAVHTAFASSTDCAGSRIVYSFSRSDGGPAINPAEILVLDNQVLINKSRFGSDQDFANATFLLEIPKTSVKPTTTKNSYETSYFEQTGKVVRYNEGGVAEVLAIETVVCKDVRYVGMPRP